IEKVMTKRPYTVQWHTSLAYVAHLMVWGGIEVIPVVNSTYELEGLVSRQDVLKALNEVQRQPQVGETIHDLSTRDLITSVENPTIFEVHVTPQMTNQLGTISNGVLSTLIIEASGRMLLNYKKGNLVVEWLIIFVF